MSKIHTSFLKEYILLWEVEVSWILPVILPLPLPVSGQRLLRMVCYSLNPETLQNHANQEVQVFVFTLRMPWSCPRHQEYMSSQQASERCHLKEAIFQLYNGVCRYTRSNSRARHRVGAPKEVLNFCCMCLKMQRVMVNIRA